MSRLLDPHNFVADKLAWHKRIATDPSLSLPAKAVAGLILHDLNPGPGGAWRGQDSMAESLGLSTRQLRRLLGELEAASYLRIEIRKGRGRTNICRATHPDAVVQPARAARENRTSTASQVGQCRPSTSGQLPENRTSAARKPDMGVRQFLYDPNRKPFARQRAPVAPPAVATRFPCPEVRQAVVSLAGEAATISYLDQATWDPAARRILCRSDTATTRLSALAGERLAGRGITIARQPASVVPSLMAA